MIIIPSDIAAWAKMLRHRLGKRLLFDAVSENRLLIGHTYRFDLWRNGELIDQWCGDNLVPAEGINRNQLTLERGGTQFATKYLLVFKNNYVPVAGDTMALFPGSGVANEASEYSEAVRPTWTVVDPVAGVITNAASPGVFTFNATINVFGSALSTNSTKNGAGGFLMSATRFSGTLPKTPNSGDVGKVTLQQTMTST